MSTTSHGSLPEAKTGVIKQIDVAAGNNKGLRIYLKDVPFVCGSSESYAYLNETASNYQTYLSVLLAAKMSKTPIRIYPVADSDGNCIINYLILLEN